MVEVVVLNNFRHYLIWSFQVPLSDPIQNSFKSIPLFPNREQAHEDEKRHFQL